jgi:hypothetical protein
MLARQQLLSKPIKIEFVECPSLPAWSMTAIRCTRSSSHVTIKNALETTRLRTGVQSLGGDVHRRAGCHNVVGTSGKITELMNFVRKAAASEATHGEDEEAAFPSSPDPSSLR